MPRALPLDVRHDLHQAFLQGLTAEQIAPSRHLAVRTVRQWLARFRQRTPEHACATCYAQCGPADLCPQLRQHCLDLRRQHAQWGAGRLRLALQQAFPDCVVPHPRTLQRWLHSAGLAPQARVRFPASNAARAQEPHEVWQMDAAERMTLANGQDASWLRVIDEHSGAILGTRVFPLRRLESRPRHRGPRGAAAVL